jgi:hypothetical protein
VSGAFQLMAFFNNDIAGWAQYYAPVGEDVFGSFLQDIFSKECVPVKVSVSQKK